MSLFDFDSFNGAISSLNNRTSVSRSMDDEDYPYSDLNFADLNDVMSSYNSSGMSPYSSGSSPDNMFPITFDPHSYDESNDIMAKSGSNSTVTANTGELPSLSTTRTGSSQSDPVVKLEEDDIVLKRRKQPSSKIIDHPISKGKKFKSPHNLIEKKYRTNINTKIVELRNCVPTLRILVAKENNHHTNSTVKDEEYVDDYEGDGYTDDEEKLDGLQPARKLNKATILSKAAEYIKHLEWKHEVLKRKNEQLARMLKNLNPEIDLSDSLEEASNPSYSGSSRHSSPSLYSNTSPNTNSDGSMSLSNKVLLGGMTCMLGASAFDDMSGGVGDRKGLFSVPIFAFSTSSSSTSFNLSLLRPFWGVSKLLFCIAMFYFYIIVPLLGTEKKQFRPLKTYNRLTNMTTADVEHLLKTADPSKLFVGLLGLLHMESNETTLFMKCLYMKKCGKLAGSAFVGREIFDRWGQYYFSQLKSLAKDSKLCLLLQNTTYEELPVMPLKQYEQFDFITQILRSLADSLFEESLMKMVWFHALNSKYKEEKEDTLELEIAATKIQIARLLQRCTDISKTLDQPTSRCSIIRFLLKPTEDNLRVAFENPQADRDVVVGLVCCVLKYQLLNCADRYELLVEWLGKLQLPKFSNGVCMSLFEFVAILNVLELTTPDLLHSLNEFYNDEVDKESHMDADADQTPRPIISKLNFRLLNVVANMRIFAGSDKFCASIEAKDQLIDFLVGLIEELNGC
ncbi:hypothetical protein KL948_003033 [Ogataea haglerorum]|nr:hypothetical protein KL948_003033 [Ogataea haglerorum]